MLVYIYIFKTPHVTSWFACCETKRRGFVSKMELVAAAQKDPEVESLSVVKRLNQGIVRGYLWVF